MRVAVHELSHAMYRLLYNYTYFVAMFHDANNDRAQTPRIPGRETPVYREKIK